MFLKFYEKFIFFQVSFVVAMIIGSTQSFAQDADFSTIARNVNDSIAEIPGLITGLAYLLGLIFGVLGILKIKEHVDSPDKAPLKEGVIRLIAGGALFGLPILYDAMLNTIGTTLNSIEPAALNRAEFNIR